MMTSESCFVWAHLPTQDTPVVCGRLDKRQHRHVFTYGRSYLNRDDAVALYGLPLQPGTQEPPNFAPAPSQILDSMPDSWGRRVLTYRAVREGATLEGIVDLLLAGSNDRIGALEFHTSPTARSDATFDHLPIEDLVSAAAAIDDGLDPGELSPELNAALLHGSSDAAGGARPKVLTTSHLVKFSRSSDPYAVERSEAVAMRLAAEVGIRVPHVELVRVAGRDAIKVERFDRGPVGERYMIVSALSILGLQDNTDGMSGRYASYLDLASHLMHTSPTPKADRHELFRRIAFNICVGNTDDHARNHAAIWNGTQLALSPAYDICPQGRIGGEARQAMSYDANGKKTANLASLIDSAAQYGLDSIQARTIAYGIVDVVQARFRPLASEAGLTAADVELLEAGSILNPSIFY